MSYFLPHIDAIHGYTPGEQPRDEAYVKLNTNENPYPPSSKVAEAIARVAQTCLPRYPEPLADSFRNAAAAVLGVDPDWIIAGNGCDDVLTILTRSFAGPAHRVRFPYPGYILYETLAQLQNAVPEPIALTNDWQLPDEFAQPADDLRVAFFPNPNSPSGVLYAKDELREVAARLPVPLVIDEAYVDFADDHCLDLVRECENVIVTRTLSKSYSLAGLRFGYAVARPEIITGLRKVKDSYNCDALSIAAAAAAIEDQAWMRDNVAKVRRTRSRLTNELRSLAFTVSDSHANFVWSTHPDHPAESLYQELRRRKILVRYLKYPNWGDGLRISVGTDDEIDRLLEQLAAIL